MELLLLLENTFKYVRVFLIKANNFNRLRLHGLFFFILLVFFINGFSQDLNQREILRKKIENNDAFLDTDPDKAFPQFEPLLQEAIALKDTASELNVLSKICWYYQRKADLQNLIRTSNDLKNKGIEYNNHKSQAQSHIFLSQGYILNGLDKKAIEEFDKAMEILKKTDPEDVEVIKAKVNAYIYISNIHIKNGEPDKAIAKFTEISNLSKKIKDKAVRNEILYINNSLFASAYLELNIDSAEYYVRKSISLQPESSKEDHLNFINHGILGVIYKEKKQYEKALEYYHIAENQESGKGDLLNLEEMYTGIIECYEKNGNPAQAELYRQKLKDIQLSISQNKNKSLQAVIENTPDQQENPNNLYLVILSVISLLLLISVFLLFRFRKKREIIDRQEELSISNEENKVKDTPTEAYLDLINMVKNDDSGFNVAFEKAFPDFNDKLLSINPNLAKSELEFFSLLKLKLSTKEIAQYRFIQTRTVQNKKYRLRKKLDIPPDVDIYDWAENI